MRVISSFTFFHPGEGMTQVKLKEHGAGYFVEINGEVLDDQKFVKDLGPMRAMYLNEIAKLLYTGD